MDTDEPANIVTLYVFNRGLTTTRSTKADIFGPDTRSVLCPDRKVELTFVENLKYAKDNRG